MRLNRAIARRRVGGHSSAPEAARRCSSLQKRPIAHGSEQVRARWPAPAMAEQSTTELALLATAHRSLINWQHVARRSRKRQLELQRNLLSLLHGMPYSLDGLPKLP